MISSLWLWIILLTFCGSCVVIGFANISVSKKILSSMRKDGWTEDEIEYMIGSSGYRRLNKH